MNMTRSGSGCEKSSRDQSFPSVSGSANAGARVPSSSIVELVTAILPPIFGFASSPGEPEALPREHELRRLDLLAGRCAHEVHARREGPPFSGEPIPAERVLTG